MMEAENLTVEDSTPETVALWRCIGCGAMGNASECVGSCDFKRLFVIAAARYADLLDYCLNLDERNEALRVLARDLHAETGEDERFARALASLRQRAKALLALGPVAAPPPAACEEEADEIWRCARCGQIEAFRDCLGVCTNERDPTGVPAPCHGFRAALNARSARGGAVSGAVMQRSSFCPIVFFPGMSYSDIT
jgi:hypothetical protein